MIFMPSRLTSDYSFEKAEQCFRRSRAGANVRVELEAQGNVFMVRTVQLDIKLQRVAKGDLRRLFPPQSVTLWTSFS